MFGSRYIALKNGTEFPGLGGCQGVALTFVRQTLLVPKVDDAERNLVKKLPENCL